MLNTCPTDCQLATVPAMLLRRLALTWYSLCTSGRKWRRTADAGPSQPSSRSPVCHSPLPSVTDTPLEEDPTSATGLLAW
jgi:hypothetical protein